MTTPALAVAVPPLNPTVREEIPLLLSDLGFTTKPSFIALASRSSNFEERLLDYARQLVGGPALRDLQGTQALGFACTGSSYLLGAREEARLVAEAEQIHGCRVITASNAIINELRRLDVERLSVLAPYPESLCVAARTYWTDAGFDVVQFERLELGDGLDTLPIYDVDARSARAAISAIAWRDSDALLLSGTGLRTLAALEWARTLSFPALSSNSALAGAMLEHGLAVTEGAVESLSPGGS